VPVPDVDAAVLQAAQVGAGWAFERIYTQLAPAVHGYLRAQGADDPEGAVNDVFLRAFRRIADFTGAPPAFRSWLFTIAHHLVVDQRRFASRRPRTVALERGFDEVVPGGDSEAEAIRRLTLERLAAQLQLLTAEQRDVLLLRFVADLSLEEVAVAQGRSVGSVKAMQHRAIESIRRRLEEIGEISREAVSPPGATTLAGA
jgi:RNA polymerase sigma-70 factor (ECF subfamily)